MGTYRIRQVKKEIRTLGLVVKQTGLRYEYTVIGVVFRGSLWLDGVMRTTVQNIDVTESSIEMITSSPHYPQIRAILVHGDLLCDGASMDTYNLSKNTGKPVIVLNVKDKFKPEESDHIPVYCLCSKDEGVNSYSIGLKSRLVDEILRKSSRDGIFPEALRMAELLLSVYT